MGSINAETQSVEVDQGTRGDEAPLPALRLPSHIPALDGIRGIAVLLVLFCHATQRPFGHGAEADASFVGIDRAILSLARLSWTGVDMFFVLSGFLITGILFDAKGKDHFFRNFYARRTVRIFPLYYACLILFLVIFPAMPDWFNYLDPETKQLPRWGHRYSGDLWYWLYHSNYHQSWTEQFGHTTDHIIHTSWSLAIEEQFYLMWPLVCYFCTRKTLLRVTVVMFFGSMVLRAALLQKGWWNIAMGWTPFRLDGLAAGAFIALVARGPRGLQSLVKPALIIGPVSAIALGSMIVLMYKLGQRRGIGQSDGYVVFGTALFSLFYGSVLIVAASSVRGTLVNRLFTHRFLRTFGKYSYAVYLLHLPVMVIVAEMLFHPRDWRMGRTLLPGLIGFYAITWTLSLLVAVVSWHLLEKHFLKLKDLFPMEAHGKSSRAGEITVPASTAATPTTRAPSGLAADPGPS
jgi:peptidoglycan/LPS O-acetylase OafA/YrhL